MLDDGGYASVAELAAAERINPSYLARMLRLWERLLDMAQARGVELAITFLDDTNIRAHAKAAEAAKKGRRRRT